jgi:cell shape-determining protein MreC
LQNNDPKSENKALKEQAAKTKDLEARLKSTAREHQRPRDKAPHHPQVDKSSR